MAAVSPQQAKAAQRIENETVYRCSNCTGRLVNDHGYWTCLDCTSVPLHSAD